MAQNVLPNYRNKAALQKAIGEGMEVRTFDTEMVVPVRDGDVTVEGPHWPERVIWRAVVRVVDGRVRGVVR